MLEKNPDQEGRFKKICFFCSCKKNGFTLRVFQAIATFNLVNSP